MSTQKLLTEVRRMVESAGGTVLKHSQGRHLKLRCLFGQKERVLVVSVSPSDGHALSSIRRDITRLASEK